MADFPIVGIGSSAGGLEALQVLFRAMPPDAGIAFVIVAHLNPNQESHLSELLGRCTTMPVVQIENSVRVEPNQVYVIAPDQELSIKSRVIHAHKPRAPRGQRHPVDSFFQSLAEDQGERAIAIVLSGTGSNGSLGLRFIKAEGGIAIAQDPRTAGFEGMPRSAIGTGVVDLVLPPEEMPDALLRLANHSYVRRPAKIAEEPAAATELLGTLLALVRAQTRRDFTCYRKQTLLRRIHRRMGLHRIETLGAYIQRLREDPDEVKALAADLTINVTGFFRDPEAWEVLAAEVIAPIVRERPSGASIRVWVPGCSTGEEAYSIAILLAEQAEAAGRTFDVKLFATDLTDTLLAFGRAGQFPGSIALDVGERRLHRFFELQGDTWCIRKALRETITFAPQNLLQDPPFSRLDLISCRNLLIYLEPEYQKRVLGLFHFALREGGHLFLGPAETISGQEELFRPVSRKWRIYRRLGATRHDVVDFPLVSDGGLAADPGTEAAAPARSKVRPADQMAEALLARYAPASALIDRRFRVHYLYGSTEEYLRPPSGEPNYNLLAMARDGLEIPLRTALRKAFQKKSEASINGRVQRAGALHPVRVVVTPLDRVNEAPDRLLVGFFERQAETTSEVADPSDEGQSGDQLQAALDTAREDLRQTIEQMEAANEELKASNEEIRSINEELQASNEELETSREELQSLNEELNTVNAQLQAKVNELEARTDDLNNLLNSTDVATLFLDRSLCIRWFTPSMKALLELLPSDIGRPISHFAQRFTGGDLVEDARRVLERLLPSDVEVVDDLGRWYVRRILPYRTGNDRIDGVVVTFSDITERKQGEEQLQRAKDFAEGIVDSMPVALLVLTPALQVHAANGTFRALFRVTEQEVTGRPLFELGNGRWDLPELRRKIDEVLPKDKQVVDFELEQELPQLGSRTILLNARQLDTADLILLSIQDITERKHTEAAVRWSEERLRKVLETDAVGVLFFDSSGTLIDANEVFLRMTGYTREEIARGGLSWRTMTPPEWLEVTENEMRRLKETGRIGPYEKEYFHKDGSRSWMLFAGASLGDGTLVEYCIDIHARKRAEQERELLAQELSHRVKNIIAVVQALAMRSDGRMESVEAFRDTFIGRLHAMARAHSLLIDSNWRGADLQVLVQQTLAAYRVDHPAGVRVEGEPLHISTKQGLGLSLVLHELGTNAAKYGALSLSGGRLHVAWQVEPGERGRQVRFRWQERNAEPVQPPGDKGFGTQLIERACAFELEGEMELNYAPEGLRFEVVFPLE